MEREQGVGRPPAETPVGRAEMNPKLPVTGGVRPTPETGARGQAQAVDISKTRMPERWSYDDEFHDYV